jgi:hypothetical protein
MCGAAAWACNAAIDDHFSTTTKVSEPNCAKAAAAFVEVDHRFVADATRFSAHGRDVGKKGLEDAVSHAGLGGDDGKDVDHRAGSVVDAATLGPVDI